MPFKDRYWWLQRLGGIAMMAGCVVLIGWTLWQSLPSLPIQWGNVITSDFVQHNLLTIGPYILLFTYGIAFVRSSDQARDRFNRRRATLRGDTDAIPLAGIALHPSDAPDVTSAPLILLWSASKGTRLIIVPLEVSLCALFLILPVFIAGEFIYAFHNGNVTSPALDPLFIIGIVIALLSVLGSFIMVIVLVRRLPTNFGRPFGLSAGPEGILQIEQSGKQRFLRWEEMRLLEVTTNNTRTSHTFKVYGSQTAIEWSISSGVSSYPPLEITSSEMVERSQSLLDLINARTGLVPRTFDKASPQSSGKGGTAALIGCLTVVVLAAISFVAGLIFVPITSSHLLNLSLAATVIYAAVAFLGSVILHSVRNPSASEQSDSAQQLPEDASISYAIVFGPTLPSRLMFALSGLILGLDLIPAILCLLAASPLPIADAYPQINGVFGPIASLILLPVGLFGLAMLVGAFRGRITYVTADATGLTLRRGRNTTSIAWDQVEHISGEAFGGTLTKYKVQGAHMSISWPAIGLRTPQPRGGDGVLPITAYGLANLVAVRTGKELTITERVDRLGEQVHALS